MDSQKACKLGKSDMKLSVPTWISLAGRRYDDPQHLCYLVCCKSAAPCQQKPLWDIVNLIIHIVLNPIVTLQAGNLLSNPNFNMKESMHDYSQDFLDCFISIPQTLELIHN